MVNTIPIKLKKINFKVYAILLSTFKKNVKKRDIVGTVVVSNSSVNIRLIPSSYDASCSDLSHLYLECGIDKEKLVRSYGRNFCHTKRSQGDWL